MRKYLHVPINRVWDSGPKYLVFWHQQPGLSFSPARPLYPNRHTCSDSPLAVGSGKTPLRIQWCCVRFHSLEPRENIYQWPLTDDAMRQLLDALLAISYAERDRPATRQPAAHVGKSLHIWLNETNILRCDFISRFHQLLAAATNLSTSCAFDRPQLRLLLLLLTFYFSSQISGEHELVQTCRLSGMTALTGKFQVHLPLAKL